MKLNIENKKKFNLTYALIAAALFLLLQNFLAGYGATEHLQYSEFLKLVESGGVEDVVVKESTVEGTLKAPINDHDRFVTTRVDPAVAKDLARHGIEFTGGTEKTVFSTLLSYILPAVFFVGIWFFLMKRMGGGGMGRMAQIGKSKAKVYVEDETGVTFEDVAGVDAAKLELREVVSFLKDKEKFGRLGARMPKGILLVGPPGTGKTLLARAVAGEAGVPFFSIAGSEFVEMFVGVGAARVRDLFQQARKVAPCIIFIDELDSLGKSRSSGGVGGHDEKEQTLNQLLNELDGFDPRSGIVLLAATNRPEVLDPALKRAGRFDREIVVDRPDRIGREAILKIHLKKVTEDPDIDVEKIAAITVGFTGADLANLVNEAAIFATRRDGRQVKMEDFTQAVERIIAGTEQRTRLLSTKDRERVAYHEMGHALAAASLPGMDPVHKISIIPRSIGALGYTMQRPTEDKFLITTDELKNRMVVLMAGRAAEELIFKEITTGAADDLAKATDVARQIVTRYGMSPALGQAVLEAQRSSFLDDSSMAIKQKDYSEETAREVDTEIRGLIDSAYTRAKSILEERDKDLHAGVELLLEQETITPEDFPALEPAVEARGD